MDGLMMDYDLPLPAMLNRSETLYGNKEIVTRNPDRSFHRYAYADFIRRAKQLSLALEKFGIQSGDRVATPEELISHLATDYPRWYPPDAVVFVDDIPRTSTGKFMKLRLREQFKDYDLEGIESRT